jgi:hypothetical protein
MHRHQGSDDLTVHIEEESRRSISALNPAKEDFMIMYRDRHLKLGELVKMR